MGDKKSFVMYKGWLPLFEGMTDEQAGQLFKAVCAFQGGRYSKPADALLGAIYDMMVAQFEEDNAKYEEVCRAHAEAGRLGGRPKTKQNQMVLLETKQNQIEPSKADKDKDKEEDKDKDLRREKKVATAPRFVKPTIEQVTEYCQERQNGVNPETFIDFYESKGWKVGSQPMKDWKACIRTWERRDGRSREKPRSNFSNIEQKYSGADFSELERQLLEN